MRRISTVAVVGAALLLAPRVADAHFALVEPESWMSQSSNGSPQKLGPCGDEGGGTSTGVVTAFQSGETITVTIEEKVYHPGHYRIALAVNDRSELPEEPVVTPADTPCGSVEIQDPPVFPVLADGVFEHMAPFSGPQSVQVTLPDNVTCDHCTLQVIEFMSKHGLNNPGGCFYHHCADVSIQPGTGASDAGADSAVIGGSGAADGGTSRAGDNGGCGCSIPAHESPSALALVAIFGGALGLRRHGPPKMGRRRHRP